MFNKLRNSIRELLLTAEYEYKLADNVNKILDKVQNRYERYEIALKDIAEDTYNDIYSLRRLAKEVLVSDEEIQIKQLKEILADFDKEGIIKVVKDLS